MSWIYFLPSYGFDRRRFRTQPTPTSVLVCILVCLLCACASPNNNGSVPVVSPLPIEADGGIADIEALLSATESDELRGLSSSTARECWIEEYWRERDPSPTTPRNERRAEHETRLAHARAAFPAVGTPGYDLRGRDYILFGPPDRRSLFEPEIYTYWEPRREIWFWADLDYLAEYWDHKSDGEFERAFEKAEPLSVANWRYSPEIDAEVVVDMRVNLGHASADLSTSFPLSREKRASMMVAYNQAVEERHVHHGRLFEAPPLWSVFALDCFRGAGGATRAELSYQIRLNDLAFVSNSSSRKLEAELKQSLAFFDEENSELARTENLLRFDRNDGAAPEDRLFSGLLSRELPPGTYSFALRLEDMKGDAMQIYTNEVELPELSAGLALSDITCASALSDAAEPKLFRKGEWNVFPHPLHSYNAKHPLMVYFEIYGLGRDGEGLNDYRLSYRILRGTKRSKRGWLLESESGFVNVNSSLLNRQVGSSASQPLIISVADLAEGAYVLEVTVEDLLAGAKVSRRVQFSVSDIIRLD